MNKAYVSLAFLNSLITIINLLAPTNYSLYLDLRNKEIKTLIETQRTRKEPL